MAGFRVLFQANNEQIKEIACHLATLMDTDTHWLSNDYTQSCWDMGNNGDWWVYDSPAGAETLLVVNAWRDEAKDYNAPEFVLFRNGKGDGLSYRGAVSEADFNTARTELIVSLDTKENLCAANGIVLDEG